MLKANWLAISTQINQDEELARLTKEARGEGDKHPGEATLKVMIEICQGNEDEIAGRLGAEGAAVSRWINQNEEFKKLASKGNLVPIYTEVMADMETPVSAYYKLTKNIQDKSRPHSFLLESVEGGENIARYSFLGVSPRAIFQQKQGVAVLENEIGRTEVTGKDVFEKIHRILA